MALLSKHGIRKLLKASGVDISDDALVSFLDERSDIGEPVNGVLIRKRGRGVDGPAPGGPHSARWYDIVSPGIASDEANTAFADFIRTHGVLPKDPWGYRIGTGAAAIDTVLLQANAPLTEEQIVLLIREAGLKERGAVGNHLLALKRRGLITKTSTGYLRTQNSEPIERLADTDADGDAPADSSPYTPETVDRRVFVERQIAIRRGQQHFREELRRRYGDRCLVTGCTLLAVLEAAHINPYRGENDNHVENGLLLRADIHTLFDLDLIGIEPDGLQLHLHPSIESAYPNLIGTRLEFANALQPSREQLEIRYHSFCERKTRSL